MQPIVETNRPGVWGTFNGKRKVVSEIDHQHLSNMYWFHLIFWNRKLQWVLDEISLRFNGQLLPYYPHIEFTEEIKGLEDKGMLDWHDVNEGDIQKTGVIKYKGYAIGAI